ncbi:alpha-ketoacid dehydrogenase subunit beta [Aquicella lusitana]|uniref:2-oxoisovalerate dehydrogenase subunit beta n=1 Tax=Aquicella lusitana TaxID=254246 RepID=A0A370G6Y1_9COXI|nr:alpha-ketoacid dehydrogenase subunit beta [Aquicella lusitana]RDI38960.1 pyruvate dehydrogenase E1 component beta subunit [Aquicella lusitana]VVC74291.1 Pyruvate dehydrogenase E1 component subunit beta [Aquicella lusitana]
MAEITLVEAVNLALEFEMQSDPEVIVMGEDVAKNGGVFRATVGLLDKFGPERVLDTPLAESMIGGVAVGMAVQGLKPVAEFQFMGFIYPAIDQIINHAARIRNRTRGRMHCPVVFRTPFGAGIHAPEHHSESTEALFAHIPGLRVVIPSSPARAYGLLLASIRNPDPVIFLEPSRLYRFAKQEVKNDGKALPLDVCFTLRVGEDVTLVTWGAMVKETLAAADKLKEEGISAEVIDVATIKPLDMETILASVEKTGRCAIVHEAPLTNGVGAEIAAQIAEKALFSLKAPPERVTGFDTVVPYARLEKYYIPSEKRIIDAVYRLMEYA